jgi:two-component system phosphate regulon sensor histidine kinase PhoR
MNDRQHAHREKVRKRRDEHREHVRDMREEHRKRSRELRAENMRHHEEFRRLPRSERPKIEPKFVVRFFASIAIVLAAIVLLWTLVQWLTELIFKEIGFTPPDFWWGVLDLVGTFVLFGLMATVIGRFAGARQIDFFLIVNDALKRISKGDFSVVLPIDKVQGGGRDNEFRKLAGNLNDMAQSLGRMEEMRQEFISNVSHEIQSPLTSIIGFAQALREPGITPGDRSRYLEIIESESRRLSRLSDNLLKLSALVGKDARIHKAEFRVDESLRAILIAAEPQWTSKSITVEAELHPCSVVADADLLAQVWQNLLQNAIKFTPRGGRIAVTMYENSPDTAAGNLTEGNRDQTGTLIVSFRDSGIGIDEEHLPRVFERFFKADSSRSHADETSGNGLGLAIVKKIVSLHNGQVRAESAGLGQGAVFFVQIPLSQDQTT